MTKTKVVPTNKVCGYCSKKLVRKRFKSKEADNRYSYDRLEGYQQFLNRKHCDNYCANSNR